MESVRHQVAMRRVPVFLLSRVIRQGLRTKNEKIALTQVSSHPPPTPACASLSSIFIHRHLSDRLHPFLPCLAPRPHRTVSWQAVSARLSLAVRAPRSPGALAPPRMRRRTPGVARPPIGNGDNGDRRGEPGALATGEPADYKRWKRRLPLPRGALLGRNSSAATVSKRC